jgi:superfamily II DNA/RNA helicase
MILSVYIVVLCWIQAYVTCLRPNSGILGNNFRCFAPLGMCSLSNSAQPERKLFFSAKSFQSIGLNENVVNAVGSMGLTVPSKIQALSSLGVSSGKHCIIADQTGSGKTLAYLLPTLQRMVEERSLGINKNSVSPFMVVLAPTAELAMYVLLIFSHFGC